MPRMFQHIDEQGAWMRFVEKAYSQNPSIPLETICDQGDKYLKELNDRIPSVALKPSRSGH